MRKKLPNYDNIITKFLPFIICVSIILFASGCDLFNEISSGSSDISENSIDSDTLDSVIDDSTDFDTDNAIIDADLWDKFTSANTFERITIENECIEITSDESIFERTQFCFNAYQYESDSRMEVFDLNNHYGIDEDGRPFVSISPCENIPGAMFGYALRRWFNFDKVQSYKFLVEGDGYAIDVVWDNGDECIIHANNEFKIISYLKLDVNYYVNYTTTWNESFAMTLSDMLNENDESCSVVDIESGNVFSKSLPKGGYFIPTTVTGDPGLFYLDAECTQLVTENFVTGGTIYIYGVR